MKRPSLAGWKNPVTRPRYIVTFGAAVLGMAAFVIVAVGATSTYWFCADVCHVVMDDAIIAYNNSPHANISCLFCHTKVNADPVSFLIHKAEFGIDGVYRVATRTYPKPPNPESEVALETPMEQCTQCHAGYKKINPSPGLKIDHGAHKERDIACTICHNRVAHQETHELVLAGNKKHDDYLEMEACFRCHSQEKGAEAPGVCEACHTPDFELEPESHSEPAFYKAFGDSSGHAELARADKERLAEVEKELVEAAEDAEPEEGHGGEGEHDLPSVHEVSYCGQCHADAFCEDCHGMEMPHTAKLKENHAFARNAPEKCAKCHASSRSAAASGKFCSDCHHGMGDEGQPWFPQHPALARKDDAASCTGCHTTMYCETCHVSGKPSVPY